ncbi:MAG: aldose 1-epimerase [Thermaerobacter sp.]|nr:aldose 1-epimerase [Thermaerobacter sp.]
MKEASISAGTYGAAPSVVLQAERYEAVVLPSVGAHLVSLRDVKMGLRFLREPLSPGSQDLSQYLQHPVPYGLPLLFPPNRISDGTFTFNGETYRFPINEPTLHNHLHGFFAKAAWEIVARSATEGSARLVLRHLLREGDDVFRIFPHRLTLELDYTLSADGLRQEVSVQNDGDRPMPFLLGFHTALLVPFAPESTAEDCTVSVNIGQQWELSDRKVPTGRIIRRDSMAEAIAHGTGDPYVHPIDALFSAAPGDGPNECSVTDHKLGVRLVYQTGREYRAWMLWNSDAKSGFFCPEPMTCLVNAPNIALPPQETGMRALAPGERWSAVSRIFEEAVPAPQ